MKTVCVFDLDGTLIDSIPAIAGAFNHIIRQHRLRDIEEEQFNYLLGDGSYVLCEKAIAYIDQRDGIKNHDKKQLVENIYKDYIEYYCQLDDTITKCYEGIKESLDDLKSQNIRLAVCTNKPEGACKNIVDKLFGMHYFDMLSAMRDGKKRKPDTELLDDILEKFHVKKDDVLYFGDTSTDMLTAFQAGVDSVGVTWGFRTREELEKNHATYIIDHPFEIKGLIDCKK